MNALDNPARIFTSASKARKRSIVFLFSGQGSQYTGMGKELYNNESVFREQVDLCAEMLEPLMNRDIRELLFAAKDSDESDPLSQTDLAQPALFVIEYAMARLWQSWGVQPSALLGHSIGEYVAATISGVFSLEAALELVVTRGKLMVGLKPGDMMAVGLPEAELVPLLGDQLSLAAVNTADRCVVSGSKEAINALEILLLERGDVVCRRLHTSHAFHSAMMDPILERFADAVRAADPKSPKILIISNRTGTTLDNMEARDPRYWAEHLRETVRFESCLNHLLENEDRLFLEMGPGRVLCDFVERIPLEKGRQGALQTLPRPKERKPEQVLLLEALGRAWLSGVEIDWAAFYAGERRHRLPLPTYPFEKNRYWVDAASDNPFAAGEPGHTGLPVKVQDMDKWFYLPSWKRVRAPESDADSEQDYLIFVSDCSLGRHLTDRLRSAGNRVLEVRRGKTFSEDPDGFTVDPSNPSGFETLFRILQTNGFPERIIHMWQLRDHNQATREDLHKNLDGELNRGFFSLISLGKAFGSIPPDRNLIVTVITNNAFSLTDEAQYPINATLTGPVRVIPSENPTVNCSLVDVILPESGTPSETRLLDRLVSEVGFASPDAIVAWRGNRRWVRSFVPSPMLREEVAPSILKESGVYLITGGMGGLGLTFAQYLASTVRARLVLLSRSSFPAREDWANILNDQGANETTLDKIKRIRAMEEHGAEVTVVSADVVDLSSMQAMIETVKQRFGSIYGVIHAAGIPGDGMIALKNHDVARKVLEPKVDGTLILDKVCGDAEVMVLCSSVTAKLGDFGQVDYCSANAFLDAYAVWKSAETGTRVISISWDAWQQVGMAARSFDEREVAHGLLPEEGVEALSRILHHDEPSVIVSTLPFQNRRGFSARDAGAMRGASPDEAGSTDAQGSANMAVHPRPDLDTPFVAPRNELETAITQLWCENLGFETVGIHDNFFELGGDSLIATQLNFHIRTRFEVDLSFATIFNEPTPIGLAGTILAAKNTNVESEQTHDDDREGGEI